MARKAPGPVGFVGLGMMGTALVGRLLDAKVPVVVWNRTPGPRRALHRRGASAAASPREVGRLVGAGIVFTMVSDGRALRSVLFGRSGVASGLAAGGLVVDLSTVPPSDSIDAAKRLGRRGIRFLDAPVGGSVDAAAAGRLLFFVGGSERDLRRARPILERWARGIEALGPTGSGSAMKLVNNLMTIGTVSLLAEAIVVGERSGLPRDQILRVLGNGGGASTMLTAKREAFSSRRYPTRFKLALARKDLALFERFARSNGRTALGARAARRWYDAAISDGRGDQDFSAVIETVRGARAVR